MLPKPQQLAKAIHNNDVYYYYDDDDDVTLPCEANTPIFHIPNHLRARPDASTVSDAERGLQEPHFFRSRVFVATQVDQAY